MIKKLFYLILAIFIIINIFFIYYLDIIPINYIYLLIGILTILFFISYFFINRKNKLLSILGILLFIIIFTSNILGSFIIVRTNSFFNSITNKIEEINNYNIIVLNDSKYKDLENIKDKEIGIINNDNNYNDIIEQVNNLVDCNIKNYDNIIYLINDLINKKIDGIIISDSYISIINDNIDNFKDDIKIIKTISIKSKEELVLEEKDVSLNSFNVYISGIDTYGDINRVSRSDVNMIASININNNKILLTNIPRDMYVPLAGIDGSKDKLTHAGIYGINTSIGTLENFLDIKIDYYVRINFNTLVSIVDYLGGIDVYSDYNFKAGRRYYNVGMNYNLSGKEALEFARNRYAFRDGDRQRGRNQQKVIEAIVEKVTKSRDINTYLNLVSALEKSFQTNMDKETITKFIKMQIENNYSWNIEMNDVNGFDSMNYTYSYPWQMLYVMLVDENSLNLAKEKINSVLEEE